MQARLALSGILLVTLLSACPGGWAQSPTPSPTPKKAAEAKAPKAKETPKVVEPVVPPTPIALKGRLTGTVDGRKFEEPFDVHGKTGEKSFVHVAESGLNIDLAMLPKTTRVDNQDAYVLDLFLHCNTNKRHIQRHAEVLLTLSDNQPIEMNNKTDKDKFTVEVVPTVSAMAAPKK
jgi:hypothetical protein